MSELDQLLRNNVFSTFRRITEIPHDSGQETQLREWVSGKATAKGWTAHTDKAGNLLVRIPATHGLECIPATCIQSHLDMVCVDGNKKPFGAERFPLQLRLDGDWLSAEGTTLGGDDGIGIAMALAVAEENIRRGPLELLFTTEEETGLGGAKELELPVTATRLVNVDSEEDGKVFIGCAGGCRMNIALPVQFSGDVPEHGQTIRITVSGLKGGHSGLKIVHGGGNAIVILGDILGDMHRAGLNVHISGIEGGSKMNAIPETAEAIVTVGEDATTTLTASIVELKKHHASTDPDFDISFEHVGRPPKCLTAESSAGVTNLILALPNGVRSMCEGMEGIPKTSNNIAIVRTEEERVKILLMPRSSDPGELNSIKAEIEKTSSQFGTITTVNTEYPGWKPDLDSPLLALAKRLWRQQTQTELEVTATHGGLECGVLGSRRPGMQMVSIGPEMETRTQQMKGFVCHQHSGAMAF